MPQTLISGESSLPVPLTSLIGREYDVSVLVSLLAHSDVRLLTLTGTGGIGKTRLAIQVAGEARAYFPDGVFFVTLTHLSNSELVLNTIAQSLGLKENKGQSYLEQLQALFQDRRSLLVLDNYEHLVVTASLLEEMLKPCPSLKILVTSRLSLHLNGEHEYPVRPLTVPNQGQIDFQKDPSTYSSVALFLDRAQTVRPEFKLLPENAPAIVQICSRLDGLPLAIELAASWVKVFAVQQLTARLMTTFQLLKSPNRTGTSHHQNLQATFEWSYQLLSHQEQTLFCRLCIFTGGFSLEAVETVCTGGIIEESEVLELLSHLIDHSLVQMQEIPRGVARYRLLEVIRQFGLEKLETESQAKTGIEMERDGVTRGLHDRHRDWYLGLVEQAEPELAGKQQGRWLDRLEVEKENIRRALEWSLQKDEGEAAARIAVCLWPFWILRGYMREGCDWLDRSLVKLSGQTVVRAKTLWAAGILTGRLGDANRASILFEESLAVWRTVGDKNRIAATLATLGVALQRQGKYFQAAARLEEALPLLREVGDRQWTSIVLSNLGLLASYDGNNTRAVFLSDESLALFRSSGDIRGSASVLTNLGMISLAQGNYVLATEQCKESLALRREIGDKGGSAHTLLVLGRVAFYTRQPQQADIYFRESLAIYRSLEEKEGIALALEGLAGVWARFGQVRNAAKLLGSAETLLASTDVVLTPFDRAFKEYAKASIKEQFSEVDFETALVAGRALGYVHILELQETDLPQTSVLTTTAQTSTEFVPAPHSPPGTLPGPPVSLPSPSQDQLTSREIEVLRLVASGLSDKAVAEYLVISPRTVQWHVRSIFNKIQVSSRTAATRYAIEHKLI